MKRPRSAADHLDQALDAAISGDASALAAHDAEAAQTWHQLNEWAALGGLDGLEPLPATPSILDEDVIHTHERPVIMPNAITLQPPAVIPPPVTASPRRRPWSIAASALAWLLVVAIGGGAIWGLWPVLRDRVPEPTPFTALQPDASVEATPTVDPDPDLVANWGGDPGESWHLSEGEPSIQELEVWYQLVSGRILPGDYPGEDFPQFLSAPLIAGDTMIVAYDDRPNLESNKSYKTIGFNLERGEIEWSLDLPIIGPYATNGRVVAGYFGSPTTAGYQPVLISLEGETPEVHYLMSSFTVPGYLPTTPVISDDILYYGNGLAMAAYDLVAQEELWANYFGTAYEANFPEAPGFINGPPSPDFVVTDNYVFVVRPSMSVTRLDRMTGAVNGSFNLVDDLLGNVAEVDLQSIANKLVVVAHREPANRGDYAPSSIVIYGADTMDPFARADLEAVMSNPVVTLEWIYILGADSVQDGNNTLFRMNPYTGSLDELNNNLPAPDENGTSLSLAGDVLMTIGRNGEYTYIDVNSGEILLDGWIESPMVEPVLEIVPVAPLQLWNDRTIALASSGQIIIGGPPPGSLED